MVSTVPMDPSALDAAQVSNGGQETIETSLPYRIEVTIVGTAPFLFHAWNIQAIDEKAAAAKGSRAKKTDYLESYVYRDADGYLGLPGTNLAAALVQAGRWMQDPRSPRKSAMDLVKSGIIPLTLVAPFNSALTGARTRKWDFEDARRVQIQRAGVTRVRPAMREGWEATIELMINAAEYMPTHTVMGLLAQAGRLVGVGDFRPTFGRFIVKKFEILGEEEEQATPEIVVKRKPGRPRKES